MPGRVIVDPTVLRGETALLVDFPELGGPLFFSAPRAILCARRAGELRELLREAEAASRAGCWVGGFLTYEAAAAFGLPTSPTSPTSPMPLAWFALFDHPPRPAVYALRAGPGGTAWAPPVPRIDFPRYHRDLQTIAAHIGAGESYQVNYTLEADVAGSPDPAALFLRLQTAHRFPRALWLRSETGTMIASLSPESFLERHHDHLVTAPIKGTRPRSRDAAAEIALAAELEASAKDRAEHVMIVDMARNDLGRVCRTGSVTVDPLTARRSFSTVHHLESRVHGRLEAGMDLWRILEALFPAASITGAPRHRTMEIIRDLERRPRGLYTGSLGVMRPGGDFFFNVAIRTLVFEPGGTGRVGLGGGVVADSEPGAEWREITTKARFLTDPPAPFDLIETFLVDRAGEIPWLARHLARMGRSAAALGFPWDPVGAAVRIREAATGWRRAGLLPRIGRLALSLDGGMGLTQRVAAPWPEPFRVRLAGWRPDALEPLARHKTTRRALLDAELHRAREDGYDEVLFVSTRGRVTEGAISSLLVCIDGEWIAPPVEDGLLPGLWRETEMARLGARSRSLTLEDLARARELRMGNAVRGTVVVERLDDMRGRMMFAR